MKDFVQKFLDMKKLAWSESTYKNEAARIKKYGNMLDGNALALHETMKELKDYTRVSIWNRMIEVYDLVNKQNNPYREFKEKNARLFKNYYFRKQVDISHEEAKNIINSLEDMEVSSKAMDLLRTGLRYSESQSEAAGLVLGKGAKYRKVFRPSNTQPVKFPRHYTTFARKLKAVGLSAHKLRKLAATRLAEQGAKEADLLRVFGWESFETAKFYLQPKSDQTLQAMMENA